MTLEEANQKVLEMADTIKRIEDKLLSKRDVAMITVQIIMFLAGLGLVGSAIVKYIIR